MALGMYLLQLVICLAAQAATKLAITDVHTPKVADTKIELKTRGWCIIWPDMRVPVGTTWKERCRKCECVGNMHTVCEGGPKCKNPYKPYHDYFCGKWSDDGCCCEDIGCQKYGKTIPFGDVYNDPPSDPCSKCQCLGFRQPLCRKEFCVNVVCVDGVKPPGECCPRCYRGKPAY
ncbi:kielin/chordin-like protein [Gigantopelta aegis]|uniref:kielin/chordin-like protein n=1 Tax=Gigantopelta aegis TaxID=1735272 RepID=UPI001B88975D|nr:kielin/chordin-like protein [Gigantopelta aegis]